MNLGNFIQALEGGDQAVIDEIVRNTRAPGQLSAGAIFSELIVSGMELSGFDFSNSAFELCKFTSCRFVGCNFSAASVVNCDFIDCDFEQADFRGVRIKDSEFGECAFPHASFLEAQFRSLVIRNSHFTFTDWGETVFVAVQCQNIMGLEHVSRHYAQSFFDHTTLLANSFPAEFLKRAGVPEIFVDYLPAFEGPAISYHSCFISYASENEDFANKLYEDLTDRGVRCWYAPESLRIGDKQRSVFDRSIQLYNKTLLILSEASIKSPWVEKEVETAFEIERREQRTVLFPIRLDDVVMSSAVAWAGDIRRMRHIGDFRDWSDPERYSKSLARVLRDLQPPADGG